MESSSCKLSSEVIVELIRDLIFFALFYLYLWFVVDLRLIYHGGGMVFSFPVFYREWTFSQRFLSHPGGLVEYISAFLAQFFCIGWAGALIVTVQAWLIWLCAGSIMRAVSGRRLRWVCFVPPILLLIPYARYSYQFTIMTALLAALSFVCLYIGIILKCKLPGLLVFLVLSIILYPAAGGAYLLFAVLCGLYELLFRHRLALGAAFLFSAPIIAHIEGVAVFNVSIVDALCYFMPRSDENSKGVVIVVYVLYLLLPLVLIGLRLAQLLSKGKDTLHGQATAAAISPKAAKKRGQSSSVEFPVSFAKKAAAKITPSLPILAGVLVAYFCHDAKIETLIAADYYASNRMWRQVLQTSVLYPNNKFINHAVNRALYHTGRLGQEMFVWPQHLDALLLTDEALTPVNWWRLFDTYIDLGHINLAEAMLMLSMETYGERPIVLKRLALINIVKGNTGAARVYLGALSRTLFDASWARGYLEKIETDPNLSAEEQVQYLRSIMPEIDRDFESLNENAFLDLLDKNRGNQMAFEYLAAIHLLTNRLDRFVGILGRLDDFDYSGIPRVYEEAILLYTFGGKKVELGGREISRESQERFKRFHNVLFGRYGVNKKAAFDELSRDYGDSYFFYYIYGQSGIKR